MNSRRSRRALVLCMAPMREHGAGGAFSAIFIDVVELATFVGGLTLPFDWYALIARTPRLEPPWTPPALASAVGLRRLGRTALEGPQIARFSPSPRLAGLAPSASPRGSRASLLLAVPHAPARLGVAYAPPSPWSQRNRAPHSPLLRLFHSVLFLCLPLCACQALLLWP